MINRMPQKVANNFQTSLNSNIRPSALVLAALSNIVSHFELTLRKFFTNSNWGPVSGLCGKRLHFSTVFHSFAITANASSPFLATSHSTSQHPITIPVLPIPPRQWTALIRPRRSLSRRTSRIWHIYSTDWGKERSWMGKQWYSTVDTSIPSCAARLSRCGAYGDNSPCSVKSIKVRIPDERRASSFCDFRRGAYGYSQASRSGVAQ